MRGVRIDCLPARSVGTQRRFTILQRDEFTCLFCGSRPGNDRLHVDHLFPWSKGGSDHDNNLGSACDRCNSGKSDTVSIPMSLCTKDVDQMGWVIWKRWGGWVLSWNQDPPEDAEGLSPFVDPSCVIALTFEPLNYWIALDRVHEPDWHRHLGMKKWMGEGTNWGDFCEAIDFCRTLVRQAKRDAS